MLSSEIQRYALMTVIVMATTTVRVTVMMMVIAMIHCNSFALLSKRSICNSYPAERGMSGAMPVILSVGTEFEFFSGLMTQKAQHKTIEQKNW